ncbi:hypothetical protein E2C01_048048 [Portunus trituberculatus]|uniref:Uncharacterized protein n=1 Tax=Portunus trituberculatus TaxID=210409 RepID=A0A5B7G2N3_PORTR|nr:hypothetical protein [Portunus trituberculatus]
MNERSFRNRHAGHEQSLQEMSGARGRQGSAGPGGETDREARQGITTEDKDLNLDSHTAWKVTRGGMKPVKGVFAVNLLHDGLLEPNLPLELPVMHPIKLRVDKTSAHTSPPEPVPTLSLVTEAYILKHIRAYLYYIRNSLVQVTRVFKLFFMVNMIDP